MSDLTRTPPAPGSAEDNAASTDLDKAVGLAFRLLQISIVLLVAVFLASGIATVAPHEVAYVQRLGSLGEEPLEPGGHPTVPLLDEVIHVDLRPRRVVSARFDVTRRPAEALDGALQADLEAGLDPTTEGYLLSGDTSAVHATLAVRLAPDQARVAMLAAQDANAVSRLMLERASVLAAAERRADSLLGAAGDFKAAVSERLQAGLRQAGMGLAVQAVEFEGSPSPPRQVKAAFQSVTTAGQTKEQLRLEAERYVAQLDGSARSQAARIRARASADASRIKNRASTMAKVFTNYLAAWRANPHALKARLLADVLTESLDDVEEAFLISRGELRLRLRRDAAAETEQLEGDVLRELGEGR